VGNRGGRAILPEDRRALVRALAQHDAHDFEALRTAALVQLAWGAALRSSECCAVNVEQVIDWHGNRPRVRSAAYLKVEQAKGGTHAHGADWTSAGQFVVTHAAARALRAYVREARARGWLHKRGPLFLAQRRTATASEPHARLTRDGAAKAWRRLQLRAGIARPLYRFHDLRHDSITRFAEECSGDAFKVARFGRLDVRTAQRYVHTSWEQVADIARRAAR